MRSRSVCVYGILQQWRAREYKNKAHIYNPLTRSAFLRKLTITTTSLPQIKQSPPPLFLQQNNRPAPTSAADLTPTPDGTNVSCTLKHNSSTPLACRWFRHLETE